MFDFIQKIKRPFRLFLARHLPPCKDYTPVMSASLDRKLSRREKISLKIHLFTCDACQNYLKGLRFMREVIKNREEKRETSNPEITLSSEAKERMKKFLKSAAPKN